MQPVNEGKLRDILAHLLGQRLLEISESDPEDIEAGGDPFVELMFENGDTLRFFVVDGEEYASGFPFCFSDPDKGKQDDIFHPDAEDAAARKWCVVEERTETGPVGHVIPAFGKEHRMDADCWCRPAIERLGGEHRLRRIVTHNEENADGRQPEV